MKKDSPVDDAQFTEWLSQLVSKGDSPLQVIMPVTPALIKALPDILKNSVKKKNAKKRKKPAAKADGSNLTGMIDDLDDAPADLPGLEDN